MPEQLKIVHVFRSGDTFINNQVFSLVARLPKEYFDVTVVGELTKLAKRRLERNDARWINMPLPETMGLKQQLSTIRRMRRLLSSIQPSVVHAHGFQAGFTALSALSFGAPAARLVFSPYGPPGLVERNGLKRRSVLSAARWVIQKADRVAVQSEWELAQLQAVGLPDKERLRLVPQGTAVRALRSDFEPGAKRRLVGLDPQAAIIGVCAAPGTPGLRTFLRAASSVLDATPNVEFVALGEHSNTQDMRNLAHELGLSGSMVFLGDRADIAEILASLNALVIPEDFMGAANYALQALANEIPIVVGDRGSIAGMVNNISIAHVISAEDLKALKDVLHALLERVPGQAEGEFMIEELAISSREAIVHRDTIDLATPGLDPEDQSADGSDAEVIQQTIKSYSMQKMVIRYIRLYEELAGLCAPQQAASG